MIKYIRYVFLFILLVSAGASGVSIRNVAYAESAGPGISENRIIDSQMTEEEAFDGVDPNCPEEIRQKQRLMEVTYYSFDGHIHQGQLVMDRALENDIKAVFDVALQERFPIFSVIPISDKRFRKDDRWNDDLSMGANNTSAFNYRLITGGTRLSKHSYGRAIDINPLQNPYIKGGVVLPPGATYDPTAEGTLTADHPIVRAFLRLGWEWGGSWTTVKDYQHFEKSPGM